MKKWLFCLMFPISWYMQLMAVRPIVTKSPAVAHYSGLSGRRYAIPRQIQEETIVVVVPSMTYQDELALAQEKNRRKRLWQLQRTSKRPEGTYKYHSHNLPIGTTE